MGSRQLPQEKITFDNCRELFQFATENNCQLIMKACIQFLNDRYQLKGAQIIPEELTSLVRWTLSFGIDMCVEAKELSAKYALQSLMGTLTTKKGWEGEIEQWHMNAKEWQTIENECRDEGAAAMPPFPSFVEWATTKMQQLSAKDADLFFEQCVRPALNEGCDALRPILNAYVDQKLTEKYSYHDPKTYPIVEFQGTTLALNKRSYQNEGVLYDVLNEYKLGQYYSEISLLAPTTVHSFEGKDIAQEVFENSVKSTFSRLKNSSHVPKKFTIHVCPELFWDTDLKESWAKRTHIPEIAKTEVEKFSKDFATYMETHNLNKNVTGIQIGCVHWQNNGQ